MRESKKSHITVLSTTLVLFFLFSSNIFCQIYNFRNYTIDDGLTQSQVYSLYQDSRGYIWSGSNGEGVNIFDGRNFSQPKENKVLSGYNILSIGEDKDGEILIGVDGRGMFRYNGEKMEHISENEKISNASVYKIFLDSKKRVWIGTNLGAFLYEKKHFIQDEIDYQLANTNGLSIYEDSKQNIWFSSTGGVLKLENGKLERINLKVKYKSCVINWITEEDNGNMWFSTKKDGVFRLNDNRFEHHFKQNGFPSDLVSGVEKDMSGNLWFFTFDSGIIKYDGQSFITLTSDNGLINDITYYLMVDNSNNIWVGTKGGLSELYDESFVLYPVPTSSGFVFSINEDNNNNIWYNILGSGLVKFNPQKTTHLRTKDGLLSDLACSIFLDSKKTMWITSYLGLQIFREGKFSTIKAINDLVGINEVHVIFEDSKNNIWIGTDTKGAYKYSAGIVTHPDIFKLPDKQSIKDISEDSEGNIWFATANGILIYNGNDTKSFSIDQGILHLVVMDLLPDYNNNMWAASYGGGLIRCNYNFKLNEMKIDTINTVDGLSNDNVLSLVVDNDNNLWAGTNNGVNKFNLDNYYDAGKANITTYQKQEGFTPLECNSRAAFKDHKGDLWFGTVMGLVEYRQQFAKKSDFKTIVHLKDILLYNSKTDWHNYSDTLSRWYRLPVNLELPYNENHLTFEFVGINFSSPLDVEYKYYLEGFDKDWSPATKNDKAVYSNLPAGSYTFKLVAGNDKNGWNNIPVTYSFIIIPPVWNRWWFYTLSTLLFGGVLLGGYKIRVQNLERQSKRLEEIVEQRTKELKESQAKIIELEKEATETLMAGGFAHEMRNALAGAKLLLSHALGKDKAEPHISMNLENSRNLKELYLNLKEELEDKQLKRVLDVIKKIFPNEERMEEILKLVHRSTDRGLMITEQILEYSRLGGYKKGEVNVDIGSLIKEIIEEMKDLCENNGIKIELLLENGKEKIIELIGDENHFHSVVKNIMLNAKDALIEKNGVGEKIINVSIGKRDEICEIEIKDNGVGINDENKGKIYDVFYSSKPETGTGLGLGMVKKIVNIYGGKITMESKVNVGTSFIVSFPVKT